MGLWGNVLLMTSVKVEEIEFGYCYNWIAQWVKAYKATSFHRVPDVKQSLISGKKK